MIAIHKLELFVLFVTMGFISKIMHVWTVQYLDVSDAFPKKKV